jgi:hypothetical protein
VPSLLRTGARLLVLLVLLVATATAALLRLLPLALAAMPTLQKFRWHSELSDAQVRSMDVGCIDRINGTRTLADSQPFKRASRFYMSWNQGGGIWENSTDKKTFAPPHSLVEVVHCARPGFRGPVWFFLSPGSGIWFNVGRTLQLRDDYTPVILRDMLGIEEWMKHVRERYDTIQLLQKEADDLRPVELVWLNQTFRESDTMRSISHAHLMCGQNRTELRSCTNSAYLRYAADCTQSVARQKCNVSGLPLYKGGWMDSCSRCAYVASPTAAANR